MPSIKQRLSVIAFFILLLGVIILAVFSVQKNMENSSDGNRIKAFFDGIFSSDKTYTTSKTKELSLEENEKSAYCEFNGGSARSAGGRIFIYDRQGNEIRSENIINTSPFLKTEGKWLLCGDFEGRWIYAINGNDIKWSKELSGNSVIGDINKDGYVSIISKGDGYKSEVTIFNNQGKKYLSKMVAKDYISGTKVLSGKSRYALLRINTEGPFVKSSLEFNNLDVEEPIKKLSLGDKFFLDLVFFDGDRVCAIGDTSAVMLDYDYKKIWQHDYKQIFGFTKVNGGQVALAVRGKFDDTKDNLINVVILGRSGEEFNIYKTSNDVEGISCKNGIVAVNEGNRVVFVSTSGKIISKHISNESIIKAFVLDGSNGVIISRNKMEFINFKG